MQLCCIEIKKQRLCGSVMTQGSQHYVPELVGRLAEPGQGCQGAEGSLNENPNYHRGPKSAGYKYQQSER